MFNLQSIAPSCRVHRLVESIRKRNLAGGALLAVFALGAPVVARAGVAPPHYTLTDLGTLPGFNSGVANGINTAGEVVGSCGPYGGMQAFLYAGGQIQAIPGAGTNSVATGINASGQVVGYSSTGAFLYSGGTAQPLADMAQAFGINDSGQIAGANHAPRNYTDAAVYYNGEVRNLGAPENISIAVAINKKGQVVVDGAYGPPAAGYLYNNGTLSEVTSFNDGSAASAINSAGDIVGQEVPGDAATGFVHAFLYPGDGTPVDLGTLEGPSGSSQAFGINDSDEVVGASSVAANAEHGFLYLNGVMYDLNGLTTGDAGYAITSAVAINATGQIAADAITPAGEEHAVLLTPTAIPLPGAAWMGLGTVGLLAGGMTCRRRFAGLLH